MVDDNWYAGVLLTGVLLTGVLLTGVLLTRVLLTGVLLMDIVGLPEALVVEVDSSSSTSQQLLAPQTPAL